MPSTSSRALLVVSLAIVLSSHSRAQASPPDVMTIVQGMQEVLEPARSSVRKIEISVSGESRLDTRWVARRVSKTFPEGKRSLLVLLDPRDVRGNALLIEERKGQEDVRWIYLPVVRRIREILPVTAYEPFMNTDFTYADLGFLDYAGSYRLLGEEDRAGEKAYQVEFIPKSNWYYSRVITWVSKDTHLPLERDYYDVSGRIWKKETFEQVTVVDGIPTPFRVVMKDVQNDIQSVFSINEVRYDVDIPKDLFNPGSLSRAAESPFWEKLESAIPVPTRFSWAPSLPPSTKSPCEKLARNRGSHQIPHASPPMGHLLEASTASWGLAQQRLAPRP